MQTQRILLLQLPVPDNHATNTPLAAGYLRAYARAQGMLEHYEITILPRTLADRAGDAALVAAIVAYQPAIVGISLYTWNSERTLAIMQRVKQQLPELIVIGGGPEVQPDNAWLLRHPGLDIAVVGEGEQTFVALLQAYAVGKPDPATLAAIPGILFRSESDTLIQTTERIALATLDGVPSPYLSGDLPISANDMLMVEVSRWCPYSCSFCLYGRNMGTRLGGRYFGLERLLAEIAWGKQQAVTQVHFIEANLNLVPPFQALMQALADLNADQQLALYAELRGEHLSIHAADALAAAGLRVAEVGLQTANPHALHIAKRRTDLHKWAAGTRRLYERNIDVLLDVILGLPGDDAAGVATTLAFIEQEHLGRYDIFTLQVLPGTALRTQIAEYQLQFQDRPPYYILGTDRLSYTELRRLRRELKERIGLDPDAIEGCPLPDFAALAANKVPASVGVPFNQQSYYLLNWVDLRQNPAVWPQTDQLCNHISILADTTLIEEPGSSANQWLRQALAANPSMMVDVYLVANPQSTDPRIADFSPHYPHHPTRTDCLTHWRAGLAFTPGYLDRVGVYRNPQPDPTYNRVSPRMWLVVPWVAQIDIQEYAGIAEIIWQYSLAPGELPPVRAWQQAGGAGVWVMGVSADTIVTLREETDVWLW
jgi:tRNA A37 methylthiotransferase MiaB